MPAARTVKKSPRTQRVIFCPGQLPHPLLFLPKYNGLGIEVAVAEIGEPERKVRREREDQPGSTPAQPVTIPEPVPANQ